jgi:hypothetical protein
MELSPPRSFHMPAFLHGTYASVRRKAMAEGRRCAEQYLEDGSLPAPRELLEVPPGAVVLMKKTIDLQKGHAAWRLYMVSDVREGLHEALDWKDSFHVGDVYEATFRDTPWGAVYYAVSHLAPMEAARVARRLAAVLRCSTPSAHPPPCSPWTS